MSEKGYDFLIGKTYFTGENGYQNVLVFPPMLSLITLDNDEKVTNWILTGISSTFWY